MWIVNIRLTKQKYFMKIIDKTTREEVFDLVREKQYKYIIMGTGLFFIISVFLSICSGTAGLSFSDIQTAILYGANSSVEGRIFWYVRLPRTMACILSGSALATSGAIIQNVLGNKLASPSIIGVNAGAGLDRKSVV